MWIYLITYFSFSIASPSTDAQIVISSTRKFVDRGHAIYWYQMDMNSGIRKASNNRYEYLDSVFIPKHKLINELLHGDWGCKEIHSKK